MVENSYFFGWLGWYLSEIENGVIFVIVNIYGILICVMFIFYFWRINWCIIICYLVVGSEVRCIKFIGKYFIFIFVVNSIGLVYIIFYDILFVCFDKGI